MLLGITSVYVLVAIKNKFKKAVYTCENDFGLDAKSKTQCHQHVWQYIDKIV